VNGVHTIHAKNNKRYAKLYYVLVLLVCMLHAEVAVSFCWSTCIHNSLAAAAAAASQGLVFYVLFTPLYAIDSCRHVELERRLGKANNDLGSSQGRLLV